MRARSRDHGVGRARPRSADRELGHDLAPAAPPGWIVLLIRDAGHKAQRPQ